ncbi:MAG: helix-turn-helix transcriptional regulator, partial [Actinobacteria bacterium]|nr:helix-turn-helix transcriptional regulator [Actinomycetota bacterium]
MTTPTAAADDAESAARKPRVRMSGSQRREQLVNVGRKLFAAKGFEAVSVEEIASKAEVT